MQRNYSVQVRLCKARHSHTSEKQKTREASKERQVILGVNIDHVATVRQARLTDEPDPVWAAVEAQLGGADGITFHLREDRRHINDRDVRLLRETVPAKLNMEMSIAGDIVAIAADLKPDQCTLVPEKREELTTEGGLDVVRHRSRVVEAVDRTKRTGAVTPVQGLDFDMIGLVRDAGHAVEEALLALPVAPILVLGNHHSGAVVKCRKGVLK